MAINRDKPTTTKPATQAAPAVTFSPEQLQQYIDEALAKQAAAFKLAMADQQAKPAATNGKPSKSAENEWKTIKAFKKLGITAKPRVDTFTFNIWVSKGFRPVEGSKAVKVSNLRLFHQSQVRKLTSAEVQALKATKDQPAAPRKAKVVPINQPSA